METVWTELGPQDEMVPIPPAGCGSCLQDSGTKILTWKHVGEGQGSFQLEQSYNFVGEGLGSFEKEVIVTPGQWNTCKVLLTAIGSCALLGLVLCILLGLLLHGGGSFGSGSYDCSEDYERWASVWPAAKKDWCCANKNLGCKPPLRGCETECNYKRQTATCAERIRWGASHEYLHQPNACQQAYNMVLRQCSFCNVCQLVNAGCTGM